MTSITENIDKLVFKQENDPEHVGGMIGPSLDHATRCLIMVLQSREDTRRDYGYAMAYVSKVPFFNGVREGSSSNPATRIQPLPKGVDREAVRKQAAAEIDPDMLAANNAARDVLKQSADEAEAAYTQARGDEAHARTMFHRGFKEYDEAALTATEQASATTREAHVLNSRLLARFDRQGKLYDGFNKEALAEKSQEIMRQQHRDAAVPIMALLDSVGIDHHLVEDNGRDHAFIEFDNRQPGLAEKISALMEQHSDAILAAFGSMETILCKPDGNVLDKKQAAGVIARRHAQLDEGRSALDAVAEKYGVSSIVQAKRSKSAGRSGGRSAG